MKPHYYVANPETFTSYSKHKTLAEATAEAEQLAEKHPGTFFEILQCLGVSSVPKASTFWMDGVDLEPRAMPSGLDAEIEKASNQYAEAIAIYLEAEDELRNSFDDHNRASYYKGRRDALTALKNLGKETK